MGTVFHLKKEGKPDKSGNSRGCWVYEDKKAGLRDTLNESFAIEIKRLREAGIKHSIKDLVDQIIGLKNANELKSGFTIEAYFEKYIEDKLMDYTDKPHRSERKIKRHEYRQRHYLQKFVKMFGKRRLEDVTGEDVKAYYRQRRAYIMKTKKGVKTLQKDTVVLEVRYVSAMFNHAIRFGHLVGVNPVKQSGITKEDRRRNRVLSIEEQDRLLQHCHGDLYDLVVLLLNTGCRVGEVLQSQWAWIDFDTRILHLPDFATKTGEARDVRLNQVSIGVLRKRVRKRKFLKVGSPYLFPSENPDSKRGYKTYLYGTWNTVLKRTGITDLKFHDLRHTHASRLKELRIDSAIIQEALGHKDPRSTARYVHVDDKVMNSVELLGSTYFGDKIEEKTA